MEMLQAHGYNVFPSSSRKYPSQMTEFFEQQTTNANLILAGNGWHLPSMASWIAYVLSNVIRRPPLPSPSAGLVTMHEDDLGDEDPTTIAALEEDINLALSESATIPALEDDIKLALSDAAI